MRIEQDGLQNMVSIHRETLSPSSRRHYVAHQVEVEHDSSEEDPRSGKDFYKGGEEDDVNYVVNRTVRHIGSDTLLRDVVPWYGYTKEDDTAGSLHYIPQHFIVAYWLDFDKQKKKALSGTV